MNTTSRIIGVSVLLGLGFTVAAIWLPWVANFRDFPERMQWLPWVIRCIGLFAFVVAGAVAGSRLVQLPGPRVPLAGARIGLYVGVILTLCGWVLTLIQWRVLLGQILPPLGIGYWVQRGLWSVACVALAIIAGHVAADRAGRIVRP